MHELSIMESALQKAVAHARAGGAARICRIRLRIGALSGVVPEALKFAFESVREGTIAESATLEIEHVPARFWCLPCQTEFASVSLLAECPVCRNLSRELRSGREMELASLEIE
jgi:hydrogenase nickel incorporation protein HypA/HybF